MRKPFLTIALISTAAVRADVMNLNELVPTHLEDASPVEEHQTIYQFSGQFDKSSPDEITWRPDIRYGLTKKIQLEAAGDITSGGNELRNGETRASVLYQINESDNAVPVISISPWAALPTGKKTAGFDPGIKVILSSTLRGTAEKPDTQVHLNYQIRHNSVRKSGEKADEVLYAGGFSRRLKEKLSLVADIIFQDDEGKDERKDFIEAGLHQELSKGFYIGYGLGKGIGPSSPDWSGILSLEVEI